MSIIYCEQCNIHYDTDKETEHKEIHSIKMKDFFPINTLKLINSLRPMTKIIE